MQESSEFLRTRTNGVQGGVGWGVYMWGVTMMKPIWLLWSLKITSFVHGMNNTLRQILNYDEYCRIFASKVRQNEWSS